METAVIRVDPFRPEPSVIVPAADVLRGGGVVAFPTETVYGLAALALRSDAVERLFTVKARPLSLPVAVQVATVDEITKIAQNVSPVALRLAHRYMPGPLTIVLQASSIVPKQVTGGTDKVGIRIPSHPVALALLRAADTPLAVTSANLHGKPAPCRAQDVLSQLGGEIEMLLDGGTCPLGFESTVIDLTVEPAVILRQGPVTKVELDSFLGATVVRI